jgi:hypothetical protein
MIQHNEIFDFLKSKNDEERYNWIVNKLTELNIPFDTSTFQGEKYDRTFTNIYLRGSSDKWIMAHYDTVRPEFSANDNSASVINAIRIKTLVPEINVAIVDGEEPPYMGLGSTQFAKEVGMGIIKCKWVLNLELTGVGDQICLGQRQQGELKSLFHNYRDGFEEIYVPFSDSDILDKYKIPNVVLFTLPKDESGQSIHEYIWYCHTKKDHPGILTTDTMEWLTDNYLKEFLINNI